jgi:hypothetical protein
VNQSCAGATPLDHAPDLPVVFNALRLDCPASRNNGSGVGNAARGGRAAIKSDPDKFGC